MFSASGSWPARLARTVSVPLAGAGTVLRRVRFCRLAAAYLTSAGAVFRPSRLSSSTRFCSSASGEDISLVMLRSKARAFGGESHVGAGRRRQQDSAAVMDFGPARIFPFDVFHRPRQQGMIGSEQELAGGLKLLPQFRGQLFRRMEIVGRDDLVTGRFFGVGGQATLLLGNGLRIFSILFDETSSKTEQQMDIISNANYGFLYQAN